MRVSLWPHLRILISFVKIALPLPNRFTEAPPIAVAINLWIWDDLNIPTVARYNVIVLTFSSDGLKRETILKDISVYSIFLSSNSPRAWELKHFYWAQAILLIQNCTSVRVRSPEPLRFSLPAFRYGWKVSDEYLFNTNDPFSGLCQMWFLLLHSIPCHFYNF